MTLYQSISKKVLFNICDKVKVTSKIPGKFKSATIKKVNNYSQANRQMTK